MLLGIGLGDVNLTGAFTCTQIAARGMIARGRGGRIVFVSSLAENVTGPTQVDYSVSKAGMRITIHWTKPGPAEEIKQRVPVGRIGTPEDIGHAAVFLASAEAAYVNDVTMAATNPPASEKRSSGPSAALPEA